MVRGKMMLAPSSSVRHVLWCGSCGNESTVGKDDRYCPGCGLLVVQDMPARQDDSRPQGYPNRWLSDEPLMVGPQKEGT